MADISWPPDLRPKDVTFYLQGHQGGSESPFTRQRKRYQLSAPRWVAKLSFEYDAWGTRQAFGRRLDALVTLLGRAENRVSLFDWRRPVTLGSAAGHTIRANGAAAIGATSMALKGAGASATAMFAGEYFSREGNLYMLTEDAAADADGNFTAAFQPPLRVAIADNATVRVDHPFAYFVLSDPDDAGENPTGVDGMMSVQLDLVEDL